MQFEEWFKQQPFYLKMQFIHGSNLFNKDGDEYRNATVQMIYLAFQYGNKLTKKPIVDTMTKDWVNGE